MRLQALQLSFVAGLVFGLFAATGCFAQGASTPNINQAPPRSVTILPESPNAPAPKPAPSVGLAQLTMLNSTIKIDNPAGLSLDLIPGDEVVAGSKVGFRITTKKQGYLILLDIDAAGKLTQIFPNTGAVTPGGREGPNLIRSGRSLTLPQLGSPYASFEFVAEPPAGMAMVVALLSDKPVQVVDLPDAPPPAFAPNDALKYVLDKTRTIMIPSEKGNELIRPNWSFDGKFYLIK